MAALTERDGEGDVKMGRAGSRADDQERGEVEENDDRQAAAPTERDGEGDVAMGSTGSQADDQGRGGDGGAARAAEGTEPTAGKKRRRKKKSGGGKPGHQRHKTT